MDITLRPMTPEERLYSYTQSSQIGSQTGNIGHLRADIGSNGEGFFSTWFDFRNDLKTEEFKEEFDDLINKLRKEGGPLSSRTALSKYCFSHPEATDHDFRDFFFRTDTADQAYLFRLNPNRGEYSYCYCYRRDWLDHHLEESHSGIRFMDQDYNELFRLQDGVKVRVIFPDGEVQERVCRYIDPTHFEYGTGALSIFHIMEFSEWMASRNAVVEPVSLDDLVRNQPQKQADRWR